MTPTNEGATGAMMGLITSTLGTLIGLNVVQTFLASVVAGFLGAFGQYLFKKSLAYYHKKRNLNEKD